MDNRDIKVTVIIPVFNVDYYLEQCIESVIGQTLKEIEIICIDDGSTDRSLEILERYAENDSRIMVYSKPNSGYGHTINFGLERSHGKYVTIVESDDFIDANGIEILFNRAEVYSADYIRSNYYEFSGGKDHLNESLNLFVYDKPVSAWNYQELFVRMQCQPWGCIYNRSFLISNNIRMNETPGASYQDNSWTFIVLLRSKRTVLIKEAFYHYRTDNFNSSIHSSRKVFCIVDEKKYIERKMTEYQISDFQIFRMFSRFVYEMYKSNYNRVAEEYQYAFLVEWKREILKQLSKGVLKKESFENSQWEEINCIINNIEDYFNKTAKIYFMKDVYDGTINNKLYIEAFIDKMLYNKIIIFGTGKVAKELVAFLEKKKVSDNIICFCETSPMKKIFCERCVYPIEELSYSKGELMVCATIEKTQKEIIKKIKDLGFYNILSIDKYIRDALKNILY